LKRGENFLKVPREIKGVASSGFPRITKSAATSDSSLFKGGEGGISKGDGRGIEEGDLGGSESSGGVGK
jgi:hypothetical protein